MLDGFSEFPRPFGSPIDALWGTIIEVPTVIAGICFLQEKGPPGERATLFRKTCKT
jgi:hypothetical protein